MAKATVDIAMWMLQLAHPPIFFCTSFTATRGWVRLGVYHGNHVPGQAGKAFGEESKTKFGVLYPCQSRLCGHLWPLLEVHFGGAAGQNAVES
jgi:hypothetical protein